jgi:phosphoribosylanthranilate isomerase
MPKVKICGLFRLEDADMVNEGLPDFAGFILTPSRRRVSIDEALAISRRLSDSIARVGVFVKESPEDIAKTASALALDGIQLHLDTTTEFFSELDAYLRKQKFLHFPFIWQRISISTAENTAEVKTDGLADLSGFDGLLLDSYHDGKDGGTGKVFPWRTALDYVHQNRIDSSRIIVAGGLTEDNVAEAISFFKPFAVDVSGGVETNGHKDREKVLRFIDAARKAQVI